MMRSRTLIIAGVLFAVLGCGGCGPSEVMPASSDWPVEIAGRRLFNTPNVYIYASSPSSAKEAEELVKMVAERIVSDGGAPSKGVVIVSGVGDEPLAGDVKRLCMVAWRGANRNDEQIEEDWADALKDASLLRMSMAEMIVAAPLELPAEAREQLGVSAELARQIPWAIAIPTRGLVNRIAHKNMIYGVRNAPDPLTGVALAGASMITLIPMERAQATGREVQIFRAMAKAQGLWDEKETEQRVDSFQNELISRRLGIFTDPRWWP